MARLTIIISVTIINFISELILYEQYIINSISTTFIETFLTLGERIFVYLADLV